MKSLLKVYLSVKDRPLEVILQKMKVSEERLLELLKLWIEQKKLPTDNAHLAELSERKKRRREDEILRQRAGKLKKYQIYRDHGFSLEVTAEKMKQSEEKMALFLEHETERQKMTGMSLQEASRELRLSPSAYQKICENAEKRRKEKILMAKKRLIENRAYAEKMLKKIQSDLDSGSSNVLIFDIEASQSPDEPIEISILDCHGNTVMDQLIRPSGIINHRIAKLTGITNAMVQDQPTIHEVMPKLRKLTENKIMLSWGIDYDERLIHHACQLTGIKLACTLGCAQKMHMGCIDAKNQIALGTAARCEHQNHRALDDCKLVLKILKEDINKGHPE